MGRGWWKFECCVVFICLILELTVYWFVFLITKRRTENIYCNGKGKIFNFINKLLHESLLLQPSIILIIFFFWQPKNFALSEECPPKQQPIIHNGIEVGIVNHSQGCLSHTWLNWPHRMRSRAYKFHVCVTMHLWYYSINNQLDATIAITIAIVASSWLFILLKRSLI